MKKLKSNALERFQDAPENADVMQKIWRNINKVRKNAAKRANAAFYKARAQSIAAHKKRIAK